MSIEINRPAAKYRGMGKSSGWLLFKSFVFLTLLTLLEQATLLVRIGSDAVEHTPRHGALGCCTLETGIHW